MTLVELGVNGIGHVGIDLECTTMEQENFVKLAQSGFYDGCPIFRIEKGYLAQSGDPTGTGKSGTQSYFDLTEQAPSTNISITKRLACKRGSVGLLKGTKSGRVGSQFFIMLSDKYPEMAKKHGVIGMISDEQFLSKLESIPCDFNGKPLSKVQISVKVTNSPFTNIADLRRAKEPKPEDNKLKQSEKRELSEVERQVVEKAYASNVPIDLGKSMNTCSLWIGNLNPQSHPRELQELLESRLDCKIVKFTHKQFFAFVEFENLEACDRAYERLKRVVIDDFKVKVDYHFPDLPSNKKPRQNSNK